MAEFVIKLADERGHVQEQVQTAATAEELRARFSHAGYHVFSVRARGALAAPAARSSSSHSSSSTSNSSPSSAPACPSSARCRCSARSRNNAAFSSQLDDVASRVKRGEALSAAFEAQSGFPVMYTTTLLAGERSGNLTEVLDRYVNFQKVALALRKKLVGSLIYPGVLLTLVFGLLIFMFTVVVPQFAKLYDQLGSKLPALTLALLSFGKWMQHNILWLALGAVVVAGAFYRFSITERGKDFVDGVRVKIPVFGKIWLKYQVALFARTLSTLLTGGLPLVPSLETAARSISSRRVSKAVESSVATVREGKSLADSLAKTGVFPGLACGDDHRRRANRRSAANAQLRRRVL